MKPLIRVSIGAYGHRDYRIRPKSVSVAESPPIR